VSSFPEEWVNENPDADDDDEAGLEGVGKELGLGDEDEETDDED